MKALRGRKVSRGRDNRRKVRTAHSWRGWYVGSVLLAIALVGGMDAGWSVLVRYATHHPYFTVQEVVIVTDTGFSTEEIQTWSGLAPGMSLWEVEPAQVEARLLAHPWIQTAQVRRDFPQRVQVTVRTRRPVTIVLRQPLTYLDDTGACFAGHENSTVFDLPYVSGFTEVPLDTPAARTALAGVLHLLSLTRLWQEPLSEIHWDPQQGYTLFLEQRRVTIRLGWETTPEKFTQVATVLADWPVEGPAALFDARFADQIVVQPYVDEGGPRGRALSRPL